MNIFKKLILGLLVLSTFSCYNALDEIFEEASYNPASLSSLDIDGGALSPSFDPDVMAYTVSVQNTNTSVKVTPSAMSSDAGIEYSIDGAAMATYTGSTGITINSLAVGTPRQLAFRVTASGGNVVRNYTVSITRQGNSDATLNNLTCTAGAGELSPAFTAGTFTYTFRIYYDQSAVSMTPVVNTSTATVKYRVDGGTWSSLDAGNSVSFSSMSLGASRVLDILVTAQDGVTTRTYTITVSHVENWDATLSGLTVNSGTLTPGFSSDVYSYTVNVAYSVDSITVTGTANDNEHATLSLNNNVSQSLSVGINTITITVTAQDGTKQDYVVKVTRAPNNVSTLNQLYVTSGSLSPAFASGTTSYTVNVENSVSTITVYCTVTSGSNATLSSNANQEQSLNIGANVITIRVTAQDGVAFTDYIVTVNRERAVWAKTVSVGPNSSYFYAVATGPDGSVYAAGYQYDNGLYNYGTTTTPVTATGNSSGYYNLVIVKYNSDGTAQWARTVTTGAYESRFNSVAVDKDGNVYAAGYQASSGVYTYGTGVTAQGTSSGYNGYNAVLVKYSSDGTAQWAKTVTGGSDPSQFNSVAVDSDGNVYAAGYQSGATVHTYNTGVTAQGTSSGYNVVLVKYNSNGAAQWAKTVTAGSDASLFNAVAVNSSGNVYAAGYQTGAGTYTYGSYSINGTSSIDKNIVLVKYNSSDGTVQWAKTVITGPSASCINSLALDSYGNVYAAGYQAGKGIYTYATGVTATGSYSIYNVMIVKYNSDGIAQWAKSVSTGSETSYFYSVAVDPNGYVYAAGYQYGTSTYTYGTGVTANGLTRDNVILVKYSGNNGTALWAKTVSAGSSNNRFYSVAVFSNSYVYAAGVQANAAIYTYGYNVTATGTSSTNVILVKYAQ